MLCRPEFHTSGQGPSSGLQASPYPGLLGRRRLCPLLAALACLVGLVVAGVLALAVPGAHERDAAMLHGFVGLDRPSVHRAIWFVAHLGDTLPYACAGLLCIARRAGRGDAAGGPWPWPACWR